MKKIICALLSVLLFAEMFSVSAAAADRLTRDELASAFDWCVNVIAGLRASAKTMPDLSVPYADNLLVTELCPTYNFEMECIGYRGFVLDQGHVTCMFNVYPIPDPVGLGSSAYTNSALDKAFRENKPIAFVSDHDGTYFVTEDSVELLGQYLIGDVSPTPLAGKDFSVFSDLLSPVEFIRLDEYLTDDEYLNKEKSFVFYRMGWNEIDGKRVYLKKDGTFFTQPSTVDGIRYIFDESGVCQGKYTGYTQSSKGLRYWKDGELIQSKWIRVKGERKYYAGADGYFVTGTREIKGETFVFDENGALTR